MTVASIVKGFFIAFIRFQATSVTYTHKTQDKTAHSYIMSKLHNKMIHQSHTLYAEEN